MLHSKQKNIWYLYLMLICTGFGAASLLTAAVGMGLNSIYKLFMEDIDPAGSMILAAAFGVEFLILSACFVFIYQKAADSVQADRPIRQAFHAWQVALAVSIMLAAVGIGAWVTLAGINWLSWLVLPPLTLLVILPPIWVFLGLGSGGQDLGPRWQVAGILSIGMTAGPLLMIVLEMVILLIMIAGGAVLIAVTDGELLRQLGRIAASLEGQSDPQVILSAVGPYLKSPVFIGAVLSYIAVIVPLIEELLKPLAVWFFARTFSSSSQGFAMGMLSGAAFAMLESLSASGDGSSTWPVIVSVRAGTSLLHITASGLVGWGITRAFMEKKPSRFFSAYLAAVLIHGIWNACAVGAGFSSIGQFIGSPQWAINLLPAAVGGMFILGLGMFVILLAAKRKLHPSLPLSPAGSQIQEESSNPL